MHYNKLGETDLYISHLGFGGMRLPINKYDSDYKKAISLIRYAIEKGINYFDIGTFYCNYHCEKAFGLATKDISGNQLIITGKNSCHQNNNLKWIEQLKQSLDFFHREYFDLYFIHYLTLQQWDKYFREFEVIKQIIKARETGLFRYLGFSSHDSPENVKRIIDTNHFQAIILPYNLLQREYEPVIQYAYQKGMGVIIMNPLAGGILARADLYDESIYEFEEDTSYASFALNYVLSNPFIDSVLSGMETIDIINHNVEIVNNLGFSSIEIESINNCISEKIRKRYIPCNKCNYCLPCVQGINIPEVIRIMNQFSILKGNSIYVRDYNLLSPNAECCIQCKECITKCPQKIDIPEIMLKACKTFYSS
jgi:hypothetical protein